MLVGSWGNEADLKDLDGSWCVAVGIDLGVCCCCGF